LGEGQGEVKKTGLLEMPYIRSGLDSREGVHVGFSYPFLKSFVFASKMSDKPQDQEFTASRNLNNEQIFNVQLLIHHQGFDFL